MVWDFFNLTMEFVKDGQRVKLAAWRKAKNHLPELGKEPSEIKEVQTYCILVIPRSEEGQCCIVNLEEETLVSHEAHKLWDKFPELLKEPEGLPPTRPGFDHAITL